MNYTPMMEQYREAEQHKALDALLRANGNKTKAARALGVSKGKLYRIISGSKKKREE